MLKAMRDSFKHLKWILFLIVFAFVFLVFADWGGANQATATAGAPWAARVNGETIEVIDFQRLLQGTAFQYEQSLGRKLTQDELAQFGIQEQVMTSLVNQKLMLQAAEEMGLVVTDQELREEIARIPVLYPNGQFVGTDKYEYYVRSVLQYPSTAEFEDAVAREIAIRKLNRVFRDSIVISDARAEQEYRNRSESAQIEYLLVPVETRLDSVTVSDQDVNDYYLENTRNYTHAAQKRIEYLTVDESRLRNEITITEDAVRARFNSTSSELDEVSAQHILLTVDPGAAPEDEQKIADLAESLARRARAGEDFGALASEYSEDPGSAATGGDLGTFSRGRMVPAFEQAAFSTPVGQISDPVRTQFGYHVIKVNSRDVPDFEEMAPAIREELMAERVAVVAKQRLEAIRARLGESATPEEFRAEADGAVVLSQSPWFAERGPIEGLGRVPEINTWAFDTGVENGAIGPVTESGQLAGPLLPRILASREPGITPLEEIRAQVAQEARRAAARAAIEREMSSGDYQSIEAASGSLGQPVREAVVRPNTPVEGLVGSSAALVRAALEAEEGAIGGPVTIDSGVVLFEVVEKTVFDPAKFAEEKANLIEELRSKESAELRDAMLDELRQRARLEVNQSLLEGQDRAGQDHAGHGHI
ncbi:MAG: SurA N-terminal domain-containing protein [Acidobacteria bacterium]|nr:SurA N-terminal domain-containing protein [Acidobacteriota bacterium]